MQFERVRMFLTPTISSELPPWTTRGWGGFFLLIYPPNRLLDHSSPRCEVMRISQGKARYAVTPSPSPYFTRVLSSLTPFTGHTTGLRYKWSGTTSQ
ncbi:hypothetical protein J6590_047118 [Homalodisca vitripennis]|nr:hypothetical protein J6590_047118 [Homalodisca vitripennis]